MSSHVVKGLTVTGLCIAAGVWLAVSLQSGSPAAENADNNPGTPKGIDMGTFRADSGRSNQSQKTSAKGTNDASAFCADLQMSEGSWVRNVKGEVVVLRNGVCRPATQDELFEITTDEASTNGE